MAGMNQCSRWLMEETTENTSPKNEFLIDTSKRKTGLYNI
jgi:hypothetical protein